MMYMILMGIAATIIGTVVGVITSFEQTRIVISAAEEAEIVYCSGERSEDIGSPCTFDGLQAIPFTAGEIIELRHYRLEGSVMVFDGATKSEMLEHLSGMGYDRLPGRVEGWLALPDFLRDELDLSSLAASDITWEVYLYEGGAVLGFIESDIELEHIILYIP
jgi:hypothetical protein